MCRIVNKKHINNSKCKQSVGSVVYDVVKRCYLRLCTRNNEKNPREEWNQTFTFLNKIGRSDLLESDMKTREKWFIVSMHRMKRAKIQMKIRSNYIHTSISRHSILLNVRASVCVCSHFSHFLLHFSIYSEHSTMLPFVDEVDGHCVWVNKNG